MRNPAKRLKVETLYVLGAGASFSATRVKKAAAQTVAPLDKDFCSRITALSTVRPAWVGASIEELRRHWKGHHPIEDCGLEAAIIRQLSNMRFFDAIHPRRRVDCTESEYLNHIGHLICFLLKKARESSAEPYRRLAAKIYPGCARRSLGKEDGDVSPKPFGGIRRVTNPARERLATTRKRVLRGPGATRAAKRRQRVYRPRD